jgi:flotillin
MIDFLGPVFGPIAIVVLIVVAFLFIMGMASNIYVKVGPNEALIVYGVGGTQIVTGSGKFVIPLFQGQRRLSLELMTFDVAPAQDLFTNQGVAVKVEAVAQIKVKSDAESIRTAAEQFLTKSSDERQTVIQLATEGHLRGIVGQLKVEQIVKNPEEMSSKVRETVAEDLSKLGLELITFTIKRVLDERGYIEAMGRPDIARIKRDADIAQAIAERDTAIAKAQAARESAEAQAEADKMKVIAQAASQTAQAEALRDLETKKAEFDAIVRRQRAIADKAGEIATNQAQQQVIAEQVRIDQVQRQEQIKVAELEVQRRSKELEATTVAQARADKERIALLAQAEQQRLSLEAEGRAKAQLAQGHADAEVVRLKGTAEAEITRSKGEAEAMALQQRADAYQRFNEAAIVDRKIAMLPELARAFAQALANVDKIVIVSTGDGHGGMSGFTGELAKMMGQVPDLVEALTGKTVDDVVQSLSGSSNATGDGKAVVAEQNPS